MARTTIDGELTSVIKRIILTQSIDDADKESLRRQARDVMQIYSRSRAFAWIWRFEGVLGGAMILMSIIFGVMGYPPGAWVAPLTIAIIGTIVFGILTSAFRSRYRARLSNLEGELSVRERKGGSARFSVVPFVCVIGPYINSYRGINVEIRSQKDGLPMAGYANLGLAFIESVKGGAFIFRIKKIQGGLTLEANECAIVTANIQNKFIVFHKQRLEVPKTAFAATNQIIQPAPEPAKTQAVAPKPMSPQPKRSLPVDQTPNELVEKSPIDYAETTLSVPMGKVSFFVVKDEVCDMLKPGDYPFSIDSFPRLKALDPDVLNKNTQSLQLLSIDTEHVYRINWKTDGHVFAKGDVEFKIANPRLFLNCVIEDELFLKADFENEVLGLVKPSIIKHLQDQDSSDYDAIERDLFKILAHSLDKFGLSVEFVGLNAFSKEDTVEQRVCVHCGKTVPGDSVFCPYCGKKQENNVCTNCGAEIPEGALFCPKCGTRKKS